MPPKHQYYWEVMTPGGWDRELIVEIETSDIDIHFNIYDSKILRFIAKLGLDGWECKQNPLFAFEKIRTANSFVMFFKRMKFVQDSKQMWEYGYITYTKVIPSFSRKPGIYAITSPTGESMGERKFNPKSEASQKMFNALLVAGYRFQLIKPQED